MSYIINKDTKDGLSYVETSQYWKDICSPLPCFAELWWPDYLTKVIKTSIDGRQVIIQLWKGWCQRLGAGGRTFPEAWEPKSAFITRSMMTTANPSVPEACYEDRSGSASVSR